MSTDYHIKYLKYKKKYLDLKDQLAGKNLNQVFDWTTKPLIDYDSKVKEGEGDCNKFHLSFDLGIKSDELEFMWCDEKEGHGIKFYTIPGPPHIVALKYLVKKIGTPSFVFQGSGKKKFYVYSELKGTGVYGAGINLEWFIEGIPISKDKYKKQIRFDKDKDLKSGFGFQIKEGCMEKKIVDVVKFKENMDSFTLGFRIKFDEALIASKQFTDLAVVQGTKGYYSNLNTTSGELLKGAKEFVKKFENLWNFCHEFANKIRKPKDCNYSDPNKA